MMTSERELESSRNGGDTKNVYIRKYIYIYVHVYIIQYFSIATENLKPILPPSTEIDCNSRATGTSMNVASHHFPVRGLN